ncbi:MAG TPA: DUF2325 domain-containing protein [Ideonella sp.]|uniref:DUF2325 domain-containing protein n=1 Tax=Ideonella sp. TaxID=1929293 RepID=UPI002E31D3A9|nr:DUF2325 domain-containing protein [Ideonella sp.]HEX5686870.1 DUF2325 domain-containing protein [Ideonella sp.]
MPTTPAADAVPMDLAAACGCRAPALNLASETRGSRRRRLWELSRHAHCPVVGVCLPMAAVRRLVDKVLGGHAVASDYELHCGVNGECRQRGAIAEALQKELDHRYAVALRATRALKTTEALAAWWAGQTVGRDVPGALWATLTHPRCDATLEESVLADIHMIQHQNGAADRADLAKLNALLSENEVLARELGAAQQRCVQQAADHARKQDAQNAALVRARAELVGRDTMLAALQEDLQALEAAVPALRSRDELTRQVAQQIERIQDLERALLKARHELERERHRASEALATLHAVQLDPRPQLTLADDAGTIDSTPPLSDRSVLCVGGRAASLPVYRRLVEDVGGRFMHHDGGEEDNVARLDTTLAAADLVICQTGCISHNAYWRVKDHCKRTGKRCVFVDNPSSASLRRALADLTPTLHPTDEVQP